jgi:hypothetical protein
MLKINMDNNKKEVCLLLKPEAKSFDSSINFGEFYATYRVLNNLDTSQHRSRNLTPKDDFCLELGRNILSDIERFGSDQNVIVEQVVFLR